MPVYLKDMSMNGVELWAFIAGLGIFLFGMSQLEEGLKALAGRRLKLFLRKQTNIPAKGILAGIFATVVLQSSSVVSLMVLAFVGAGIFQVRNALGIIFGTNLGTTFTGWIVAILGFKIDIAALALPLVGVGSLGMLVLSAERKEANYFKITIGLGFLLFGLYLMKQSMEQLSGALDVQLLQNYPPVLFLLAGMLFTAIIQSSSATMMITLSALNSGIIELYSAAALIIGADLGTTGTVLLGAIKGSAEKRQVAMGHFLFNLITDILAFLLLPLILQMLASGFSLKDPLYTLVAFHSSINLMGILIFVPFIEHFAKFLRTRFSTANGRVANHLSQETISETDAAIFSLRKETQRMMNGVLLFNCRTLKIKCPISNGSLRAEVTVQDMVKSSYAEQYGLLKTLEGEILDYAVRLQQSKLEAAQGDELQKYLTSVRNMVAAAKCLKDVRHNLVDFRHSSRDQINSYYQFSSQFMLQFYQRLNGLWEVSDHAQIFEQLLGLQKSNNEFHNEFLKRIYADIGHDPIVEVDLSTLLNVNRELFTSNRNLLEACQLMLLDKQEREDLVRAV